MVVSVDRGNEEWKRFHGALWVRAIAAMVKCNPESSERTMHEENLFETKRITSATTTIGHWTNRCRDRFDYWTTTLLWLGSIIVHARPNLCSFFARFIPYQSAGCELDNRYMAINFIRCTAGKSIQTISIQCF